MPNYDPNHTLRPDQIIALRKKWGFTIKRLSAFMGMSMANYKRYETEEHMKSHSPIPRGRAFHLLLIDEYYTRNGVFPNFEDMVANHPNPAKDEFAEPEKYVPETRYMPNVLGHSSRNPRTHNKGKDVLKIKQICAIWKIEAEVKQIDEDNYEVFSPKAGGKYQTSGITSARLRDNLTDDGRIKLTDWLVEQREKGAEVPYIDMDALQNAQARLKKTTQERTKSLMLYLVREYKVGDLIDIDTDNAVMMLMAHSSSSTFQEVLAWLRDCESEGYLRDMGEGAYCLEVAGIRYVEGLADKKNKNTNPNPSTKKPPRRTWRSKKSLQPRLRS